MVQLGQRQADGRPLLQHLQAAQARSGYVHPLLAPVPLPPGGAELWGVYARVSRASRNAMGEAGGIKPTELDAWQRLHGVRLTPWEVSVIEAMDDAARAAAARTEKAPGKPARPTADDEDD